MIKIDLSNVCCNCPHLEVASDFNGLGVCSRIFCKKELVCRKLFEETHKQNKKPSEKYEFTGEVKDCGTFMLHRIRALRSFGKVNAGDLGGWIEKEENLSHHGTCWVNDDAIVCGDAKVLDCAQIYDSAMVYGNALVYDTATVYDNAKIGGNAKVYNHAEIFDRVCVLDNAEVYEFAELFDNALVKDHAKVHGYTVLTYGSRVFGDADIYEEDETEIENRSEINKKVENAYIALASYSDIESAMIYLREILEDR